MRRPCRTSLFWGEGGKVCNRRKGDPERAAPKVRFRHDRHHSHSAGDLPGNHFTTFPDGFVQLSRMPRPARLDLARNPEVSARSPGAVGATGTADAISLKPD